MICESIKNTTTKLNIFAIGITSTELILLTNDYYIYNIPIQSLGDNFDKLYLYSAPVPLKDRYPNLYNDYRFKQTINKPFNAFVLEDSETDWLCITTWHVNTQNSGINYNIKTGTVEEGWIFNGYIPEVLISTNYPGQFYALRKRRNGNELGKYKIIDSDNVHGNRGIGLFDYYYPICIENDKIYVNKFGRCNQPNDWPVLKGYVANKKFYLFAPSYVYIFPEDVYSNSPNKHPIIKKEYSGFIFCPGELKKSTRKILY